MIELEEGVRMISNIIECPHDSLKNGMNLEVVFDDISAEFTLPKWKPAKE